jgi:hypothetical protein
MKTTIILFLFLFAENVFCQKTTKIPSELTSFIPAGYEVLEFVKGDINQDKLPDFVVACKSKKEANGEDLVRPLLLILQDANKKFKLAKRTDKIIMCAGCGGMMGDPFSGIEIKNGNFTIMHYGGSSWRWTKDVTFRFDAAQKNWVLSFEKNLTFHSSDLEKTAREYGISENEFSIPKTIDNYNGEDEAQVSNWKVKANKTFFYNQTDEKTIRKAFLVKGNKVETYVETKNFIWVEYPNKTDEFKVGTLGFILKKDLEKIK